MSQLRSFLTETPRVPEGEEPLKRRLKIIAPPAGDIEVFAAQWHKVDPEALGYSEGYRKPVRNYSAWAA